ncbi:MAG: hypothetical protein A2033_17320 [Bacteroidetes bacterium GWA2_31_9]|nr:MAG: hypothetical protein A2033_17320 [Bacteroidetes bacterium GWA2_31_9]
MKSIFFVVILNFFFNYFTIAQTSTDTIYRSINTQQGDSLIQANSGNSNFIILDMRTPSEYSGGHVQNAINMNYNSPTISSDLDALDKNKIYLLYCAAGSRSTATFNLMKTKHFRELYNMLGGISQWISLGYPVVTGTTEITENSVESIFEIFPNPCSSNLFINCVSTSIDKIKLYDFIGREVQVEIIRVSENKININLNAINRGIYFVCLIEDNNTFTERVIVY